MKKETLFYLSFIKGIGWKSYRCKATKSTRDPDGTQYYTIKYLNDLQQKCWLRSVPSRDLVNSSKVAWEYCSYFNDIGGYK